MSEGQSGRFECTSCKRSYGWKPELAGKKVKCKCGAVLLVPAALTSSAPPKPPPPKTAATDEYELAQPDATPAASPAPATPTPPSPAPSRGSLRPASAGSPPAHRLSKNPAIAFLQNLFTRVDENGLPIVEEGRPLQADDENALRSRNIVILGIISIVGFLMPIISPMGIHFPNIQAIGQWGVGAMTVFMMLYPFLAGVGAIALAMYTRSPVRGLALIGAGILPFIIMLADPMSRSAIQMSGQIMRQSGARWTPEMSALMLGMLGWCFCTVGARARWYRPASRVAFAMGAIGAGLYLLFLFAPILPSIAGRIPLMLPFKLMAYQQGLVGFALLVAMLFTLGASILCVVNLPSRTGEAASSFAIFAFRLQIGAMAILTAAYGLLSLQVLSYSVPDFEFFLMFTTLMIKGAAIAAVILFLIPFGVIDLIIGEAADSVSARGKRVCIKCGYDMTGIDPRLCPECGARQIAPARAF